MKRKIPLKDVDRIFIPILLLGTGVACLGALGEGWAWTLTGIAVMFGGLGFRIAFYRCPHCERFLGRSGGDYCCFCGQKLHE